MTRSIRRVRDGRARRNFTKRAQALCAAWVSGHSQGAE